MPFYKTFTTSALGAALFFTAGTTDAAALTIKDNVKGTRVQASSGTSSVFTFDKAHLGDASLLVNGALPINAYSNGRKNYVLRIYHNCEATSALVNGETVAARTGKNYNIALDRLVKDKSARFGGIRDITLAEKFEPLAGTCRLNTKLTYVGPNGRRTRSSAKYKYTFTESPASIEKARCDVPAGSKNPDLDLNGIVTATDAIYVANRVGTADLRVDINNDGNVTKADADFVNSRISCEYPVEKCAVSARFNSPDIDGNGQVTPTDFMYVNNRVGSSDLSADINGNGAVTPLDARIVSDRIGCEY